MNKKGLIFVRGLLAALLLGVGLVAYWAYYSNIDIIIRAQGVVIPSGRVQIIQTPDGGVLENILVKEGDFVEKGAVLVVMDSIKSSSQYKEILAKKAALEADIVRLKAEVGGVAPVFSLSFQEQYPNIVSAQYALYSRKKEALDADLSVLRNSYGLIKAELDMNLPMVSTGEVSEVDSIRLKRQLNESGGQIAQRKNKYLSEAQSDLAKVEGDFSSLNEALNGYKNQVDRAQLVSPTSGVVKNIKVTTEGAVLRAAEEIMQIVPANDELLFDIKIDPRDVAAIYPGMPVNLKVDAYDYTIYGTLDGELTYLSADSFKDENVRDDREYYRGKVSVKQRKLRSIKAEKIEIIPGMTAVAEIRTGQRTVMQYLLKPITSGLSESLHER